MDPNKALNMTMLCDFYELTMGNGYLEHGMQDRITYFDVFFRSVPDDGGYAIAAGLEQIIDYIENLHFTDEDIAYLRSRKLFSEAFLDYLKNFHFTGDIWAVPEGTPVFPREPLITVRAPAIQAQLVETYLLLQINHQSLIATKASRICRAAQGRTVLEFGSRRAQGADGAILGARAAYIGGCAGTACTISDEVYGVYAGGTMAHSWVQMFDSELDAFRAYCQTYPDNATLLVDTYNVEQGIDNAITVGLEMRERGEKLSGIRIDSGDLAWLAKMARRKLDAAGLTDCGIVLSNDLDEYTIQSILEEGAQVSAWGVGTKLACAYDQPTLGGVYKLSATRKPGGEWVDHLKISESAKKLTFPGVLDVRRYYHEDGHIAGDMVFDTNAGVQECETIVDPLDSLRRKRLGGKRFETLLAPLARNGKTVLAPKFRDALAARERARAGLATLDESQKRMLNPHSYPVGLEHGLFEHRSDLVAKLRGF